ncbi:hypothetical protein K493DRAFT_305356 [Basidiobolus meristosporus CBS 931.73]|uniref:BTB domain-containing protein n=1 Tax=Basidiobolus meristosporus CBS 931.73 TaxID=1314790 RepID=A0A1Y1XW00_9FUNG|nr:hypothetical protein K493DRAFT_305356 [Basidiobolus meristosporus CBS 931.73]|eukprot:ORX89931.1 hypothetical protein K493DRAFT_305356 [Basidiobolus meristosporus CBS 931.73]
MKLNEAKSKNRLTSDIELRCDQPLPALPCSTPILTPGSYSLEPGFRVDFSCYFQTTLFADAFILHPNTSELIPVHRILLATQSGYFERAFRDMENNGLGYSEDGKLMVGVPIVDDHKDCLRTVVGFMYSQRITVSAQSIVPCLAVGEILEIPTLIQILMQHLNTSLLPGRVFRVLREATEYHLPQSYIDHCFAVIIRYYTIDEILQNLDDIYVLPETTFMGFIEILKKASPLDRIQFISGYVRHQTEDWDEMISLGERLFRSVDFSECDTETLEKIFQLPGIPRERVVETMLKKLKVDRPLAESPKKQHPVTNSSWKKIKAMKIWKGKVKPTSLYLNSF